MALGLENLWLVVETLGFECLFIWSYPMTDRARNLVNQENVSQT